MAQGSQALAERSRNDRVTYDVWHEQGWLKTTPGATVSYDYVAMRLRDLVNDHRIQKIAFDRWGMNHLKPALLRAGFSESEVKDIFIEHGFKSMSPALRDLEALILEKKIRHGNHGNHPVLSMCMENTINTDDTAGNRKLDKKRSSGRIDGAIARGVGGCAVRLDRKSGHSVAHRMMCMPRRPKPPPQIPRPPAPPPMPTAAPPPSTRLCLRSERFGV